MAGFGQYSLPVWDKKTSAASNATDVFVFMA
jgi:hypothetical protein